MLKYNAVKIIAIKAPRVWAAAEKKNLATSLRYKLLVLTKYNMKGRISSEETRTVCSKPLNSAYQSFIISRRFLISHILSGADTPRICNADAMTLRVAVTNSILLAATSGDSCSTLQSW